MNKSINVETKHITAVRWSSCSLTELFDFHVVYYLFGLRSRELRYGNFPFVRLAQSLLFLILDWSW